MDNRQLIMEKALELFCARGYDAVGVQEIAEQSGITKPTLYYYFGSKQGLMETILEENSRILEEMLEKLSAVVEDRREEENSARKEQEVRQAKLEAFRQKLLEDGIDPTELLASVGSSQPKAKSTRAPRPAKYKYTDENGNEQTWTGQGRTPKAIAAAIEAGKTLEDFAI